MKALLLALLTVGAFVTAHAQTVPTPNPRPGATNNDPPASTTVQTAADHTGTPSGAMQAKAANDRRTMEEQAARRARKTTKMKTKM